MTNEQWAAKFIAEHMECFECPDEVKRACDKRNNGGDSCVELFENYLRPEVKNGKKT